MDAALRRTASRGGALLALAIALGASPNALAADYPGLDRAPAPMPRFFPRSDGTEPLGRAPARIRRLAECAPREVPIPTDAPDDPSYVGSPYGLGRPSYYGFRPALGNDDPSSRPLRYCP